MGIHDFLFISFYYYVILTIKTNKKMLKKLSIIDLDAYLRLCERNMEFLATKRRINPSNVNVNKDFNYTMSLRNKIYDEINNRLKNLNNNNETIEETI